MSEQNVIRLINTTFPPEPEMPSWVIWLIIAGAFALIIGLEALRKHIAWSAIRDAICRVYAGEPLDGVNIAFKDVQPQELCLPLRQAVRQRLAAGQKPRQKQVSVSLHGPLSFLMGVADVEVRCDFTVDGAAMQESVRLLVHYQQARDIITPVCIYEVEEYVPPLADDEE